MSTGYDNSIPILQANKNANIAQGVTLKSIDSKLTSQSTETTQTEISENTERNLNHQQTQTELLWCILKQLELITGEEIDGRDKL